MAVKKSLPLGRSSFKALREDNCLYIDKTEMLFQVMNNKRYNFFARPRRFGKSLLLSTLKEIFLGRKELFADLWIGQHSGYTWPVYPVIYIDMNMIDKTSPEALEASLRRMMDRIAFEYSVENCFAESSRALVNPCSFKKTLRYSGNTIATGPIVNINELVPKNKLKPCRPAQPDIDSKSLTIAKNTPPPYNVMNMV
jgi:hypothetical protein